MATLDELELRLRALEQAQAAEPISYYTSIFSGEEMDQRLAAAGVLGAASTPQEALAALGAAVQENELDNAYFVGGGTGWGSFPVNQRGKTQYAELATMFDRWKYIFGNNGVVTLTENGVSIIGGEPYSVIRQTLKRGLPVGTPYTLSILNFDGTFSTGKITVPARDEYSSNVIIPGLLSSSARLLGPDTLELVIWPGETVNELEFIKLEPGNTQTAAYQKSDGTWAMLPQNLSYQQELAKCQAYLQIFGQYDGFICTETNSAYSDFMLPLSVPFRTQPVVVANGGLDGLGVAWYNKGNLIRMRIQNRAGTLGEGLFLSSDCILSAEL